MKKILLFFFFILSVQAYGQGSPKAIIKNWTSCDITFYLYMDDALNPCTPVVTSPLQTIPPGGTLYLSASAFGGLNFIGAMQPWSSLSCYTNKSKVGESCMGLTLLEPTVWYTTTCPATLCGNGKMEWDISASPMNVNLLFY